MKLKSHLIHWKLSLIFTILTLIILYLLHVPRYETNDDIGIVSFLHDTSVPMFISPILSFFFHMCYGYYNTFPFWSIFLYACQFCSLLLLFNFAFNNTLHYGTKIFSVMTIIFIYCHIFWYLSFASTSLLLGISALITIFSSNYSIIHTNKIGIMDVLSGFLLGTAYLIRPSFIFIFGILIFPIILIFIKNKAIWKLIAIGTICIFFITSSFILNESCKENSYNEFQQIRSKIIDYEYMYSDNYNDVLRYLNLTKNDIWIFSKWWGFDSEVFSLDKMKVFSENAILSGGFTFSIKTLFNSILQYQLYFIFLLFCIIGLLYGVFKKNTFPVLVDIFTLQFHTKKTQNSLKFFIQIIFNRIKNIRWLMNFFMVLPSIILLLIILGSRPVERVVIPLILYVQIILIIMIDRLNDDR